MNTNAQTNEIQENALPDDQLPAGDIFYATVHLQWEEDGQTRGCKIPVGREVGSLAELEQKLLAMAASIRIAQVGGGRFFSAGL